MRPVLATYYDGPTPSIDHNLYIRGNLVYESNYRSGLRVLDASEVAQGPARGRILRHLSLRRCTPRYNGAWSSYPFFASGSVVVNGIEQGLFVLRPRATPRPADRTSVTIAGPGQRRAHRPGLVVRREGREPRARSRLSRRA